VKPLILRWDFSQLNTAFAQYGLGRLLLLIVGDGIREGVEEMTA
jgi:hypothetical protein